MIKIEKVKKENYRKLLEVWEASVRATHDFITEEDIEQFKPMIIEHAFPSVELRVAIKNNNILGFIGISNSNVEMLFVDPLHFKKGIGKTLLQYAIKELSAKKVDVNEQNPEAYKFYKHMGFKVVSRSPLDGQGKPFPILHLELAN